MILRKATFNDCELLLNWRNDADTRNNFHNPDIIKMNNHQKWLISVLENKKRQLFIGIENEIPVGTVRADFDEITDTYELSWTISPNARGKGLGRKMVKLLAERLSGTIRAEIKKVNISSIKIAEFIGMKLRNENNDILYYSN